MEENDNRRGRSIYYAPTAKEEGYNIIIHWKNAFDQTIKNYIKTYDNIQTINRILKLIKEIITQLLVW